MSSLHFSSSFFSSNLALCDPSWRIKLILIRWIDAFGTNSLLWSLQIIWKSQHSLVKIKWWYWLCYYIVWICWHVGVIRSSLIFAFLAHLPFLLYFYIFTFLLLEWNGSYFPRCMNEILYLSIKLIVNYSNKFATMNIWMGVETLWSYDKCHF